MQVLLPRPPLSTLSIVALAAYPAFSEELLWRGAVLGNVGPAPLCIGLAAAAATPFGWPLSKSGVFRGFMFVSGIVYGCVFVVTGSVWAAMIAHATAELVSTGLWMRRQSRSWIAGESCDSGDEPP